MLLAGRVLNNVGGPNAFTYDDAARFTESDPVTVTIQLIDASMDPDSRPSGRRFVPAVGATLQISVNPLDDTAKITRSAAQPYVGDASIWQFQLLATDVLRGTQDIVLRLTEGSVIRHGIIRHGISATPLNQSFARY